MADKRISQLVDRGTVANNDVVPIVVSGAVTTNKATISSIQTFMQGNLDLGVTSVGITLGSSGTDVSVTGSPITTSGNITINIPTASASNRGLLSSADWITFNAKQPAGNYVTLDTVQTITAQKSFTSSGSSDTMIISHGSGSGFALDVIKAGNGPALRVNKTSGSGNAMTVIGGNFEAPAIVRTGGTSSQFLKADGSVDSTAYYPNSNPSGFTSNVGTVTSVSATAGTGISISGSPITSSGTLNITNTAPDQVVSLTASTGISVSGSYPNFTITNTSPSSGGTVTNVTASAPLASSGGATPNLSITQASGSTNGFLSSTDWNTFNNKANANGSNASGTWGINITGSSSSVINTVTGTNSAELVRGNMADNDQFRILVGGTASNEGFAEIATADDGTEPIHVRQYTGAFVSLVRTATLLDGSGNTSFPGSVTGGVITGDSNSTGVPSIVAKVGGGGNNGTYGFGNSSAYRIRGGNDFGKMIFDAGSAEQMVLTSAGNVAIGAATPFTSAGYRVLDLFNSTNGGHFVVRSANVTAEYQADQGSGGAYLGTRTNHFLSIRTNTLERMNIASNGNVSINQLSGSGNRIAIFNSFGTFISAVIGSGLAFDGTTLTATGGSSGSISGSGTSGIIPVFTGASSIGNSVITQSGSNIGIGAPTPDARLTVTSTTVGGYGTGTPDIAIRGNVGGNATALQIFRTAVTGGNIVIDAFRAGVGAASLSLNSSNGGNVGIGTSTPGEILHLSKSSYPIIKLTETTANTSAQFGYDSPAAEWRMRTLTSTPLTFGTNDTERMRITSDTAAFLRMASGTGGIQFNGDTAAANALDDYEEGTWTMGISFGGASVGTTYNNQTGTYTKIGRKVTVTGWLNIAQKGSSVGAARITGLPFATAVSSVNYAAPSFRATSITYVGMIQGYPEISSTTIQLEEIGEGGTVTVLRDTDFSNGSTIIVSLTYFV